MFVASPGATPAPALAAVNVATPPTLACAMCPLTRAHALVRSHAPPSPSSVSAAPSTLPIRADRTDSHCLAASAGPDDPSKVRFAAQADDGGCFVAKQSENNCYDYATDIVTNTFAQPGRGSGVCPKSQRPCVKNACDDVRHAAESDGLAWVGTQLPSALPTEGHYVSLHIWPQTNFHWLRMDADLRWSHKPGGSPVRNVDNNGQVILDPSKADVSPWSEHCGYMHVLPSNVSIY